MSHARNPAGHAAHHLADRPLLVESGDRHQEPRAVQLAGKPSARGAELAMERVYRLARGQHDHERSQISYSSLSRSRRSRRHAESHGRARGRSETSARPTSKRSRPWANQRHASGWLAPGVVGHQQTMQDPLHAELASVAVEVHGAHDQRMDPRRSEATAPPAPARRRSLQARLLREEHRPPVALRQDFEARPPRTPLARLRPRTPGTAAANTANPASTANTPTQRRRPRPEAVPRAPAP